MLRDRNNTARVYDENAAKQLIATVIEHYIPEFVRLNDGLLGRYADLLTTSGR